MQAATGAAWILGTAVPGRVGALLLAGAAAAGSDVTVSVWPHSRLGTLLIVFALAVPLAFVHQLARAAARVRVRESLTYIAVLVVVVSAPAALLQLRHEFSPPPDGGRVVGGLALVVTGALVVAGLVDLVMPAPRFDLAVPRGLLGVVAAAGLGASVGHLTLHGLSFPAGRGAVLGAALGALTGFFAVAAAFVVHSVTPAPESADGFTGDLLDGDDPTSADGPARGDAVARRFRTALTALLPVALIAPVAFLLCLAIRA